MQPELILSHWSSSGHEPVSWQEVVTRTLLIAAPSWLTLPNGVLWVSSQRANAFLRGRTHWADLDTGCRLKPNGYRLASKRYPVGSRMHRRVWRGVKSSRHTSPLDLLFAFRQSEGAQAGQMSPKGPPQPSILLGVPAPHRSRSIGPLVAFSPGPVFTARVAVITLWADVWSPFMKESHATLNKYRMRWIEITEGKTETVDAIDWGGNTVPLKVFWNPSNTQMDNLLASSKDGWARGLLVGDQIVMWDAYHTEHVTAARALGLETRAQRADCFYIHHYGINDNRIGPPRSAEELATIPTLARLVATGRYRIGGPDHALNESILTEGMGLHGWWITLTGEHIDIDHDNDQHHADVAAAAFDIEVGEQDDGDSEEWQPDASEYGFSRDDELSSAEEAIKTALDFGWVRGSGSGHGFTIEWETLSRAARKAVLAWMTAYGPAYRSLMIGKGGVEYKRFDDDVRAAIAYVNAETLS